MPNPYHLNVDNVSEGADVNALERPSVMETFRNKVDKFWTAYRQLEQRRDEVPDRLQPQYNDVMQRGGRIRATIESITNTYDAVADWVSDVFGFSGMGLDGVRWGEVRGGQLGAIQFVPLAIIGGALALITKWLTDAYTLHRKLDEVKRLEAQGYDPERAAELANKTISGPGMFNLGINMKPILLLGGALALWFASRKGWI